MTTTDTTFTQAELATIHFALVDRHNKLRAELKDETAHDYVRAITQRQYADVLNTLSAVQAAIEANA